MFLIIFLKCWIIWYASNATVFYWHVVKRYYDSEDSLVWHQAMCCTLMQLAKTHENLSTYNIDLIFHLRTIVDHTGSFLKDVVQLRNLLKRMWILWEHDKHIRYIYISNIDKIFYHICHIEYICENYGWMNYMNPIQIDNSTQEAEKKTCAYYDGIKRTVCGNVIGIAPCSTSPCHWDLICT